MRGLHPSRCGGCGVCPAAAAAIVLAGAGPATGQSVIFDNGSIEDSGGRRAVSDADANIIHADNFQLLPGQTTIGGIEWEGLYSPASAPDPDDFSIRIYADNAGLPMGNWFQQWTDLAVDRVFVDPEVGVDFYRYTVELEPLALEPDTTYWVSIVNDTTLSDLTWSWGISLRDLGDSAQATGTGLGFANWIADPDGADFAFKLLGVAGGEDFFWSGEGDGTTWHGTNLGESNWNDSVGATVPPPGNEGTEVVTIADADVAVQAPVTIAKLTATGALFLNAPLTLNMSGNESSSAQSVVNSSTLTARGDGTLTVTEGEHGAGSVLETTDGVLARAELRGEHAINAGGGAATFRASSGVIALTGPGSLLRVDAGTLMIESGPLGRFELDDGAVLDTGNLVVTVTGHFDWRSGTVTRGHSESARLVLQGETVIHDHPTTPATLANFLHNQGIVVQNGRLVLDNGIVFNFSDDTWIQGAHGDIETTENGGLIVNNGTWETETGTFTELTIDADFDNGGGVMELRGGANGPDAPSTLTFTGTVLGIEPDGTWVQGGSWIVNAGNRLNIPGVTVRVLGDGTTIEATPESFPQYDPAGTLPGGTLIVPPGETIRVDESFRNEGRTEVREGGRLILGEEIPELELENQPEGEVDSALEDLTPVVLPSAIGAANDTPLVPMLDEGFVFPNGGTFRNHGIVRPGGPNKTGWLPVQGEYVQTATGVLEVELAGTMTDETTEFDRAVILGDVTLGGTLALAALDGFVPAVGDLFELVTATSITGRFDRVTGARIGGLMLAPIYGASHVTLAAALPADFDLDGDVDAFDLGIWQTGFGITGGATAMDGDADADGDVDAFDLGLWQTNFGTGVGATVPEPATWCAMMLSSFVVVRRRRRQESAAPPRMDGREAQPWE